MALRDGFKLRGAERVEGLERDVGGRLGVHHDLSAQAIVLHPLLVGGDILDLDDLDGTLLLKVSCALLDRNRSGH